MVHAKRRQIIYLPECKGMIQYIKLHTLTSLQAPLPEKTLSMHGSVIQEKKDLGVENCFQINSSEGDSIVFRTSMSKLIARFLFMLRRTRRRL